MKQKTSERSLIRWLMAAAVILAAFLWVRPADVMAESREEVLTLNRAWNNGVFESEKDVFYYEFTVPSDGWVSLDVQDLGFRDDTGDYLFSQNCQMKVLNEDRTNINDPYYERNAFGATEANPETISTPTEGLALKKGTYVLQVSHSFGDRKNPVDFRVRGSFTPADNDDTEANNSFSTATDLDARKNFNGFLSCSEENDYYIINVPSKTTINVSVNSSVYELTFSLWNADLQMIGNSHDVSRGTLSSPVSETAQYQLDPGVYYVKISKGYFFVSGVDHRTGKYTVNWNYSNDFSDVDETSYYYKSVYWAFENGITSGTSDTTFSPDRSCTRGQIITFLYRMAGSPSVTGGMAARFRDVPKSSYYYDAVEWALENGIASGTSATTFSPDRTCTRGQSMTFIYRYEGSPNFTAYNRFSDVKAGAYYADAVEWAADCGITSGTSASTFSPDAPCVRGQVVTFLYRLNN